MGFKGKALNILCSQSGGLRPPLNFLSLSTLVIKVRTKFALRKKDRLRASPLKPTKGSAVGDYLWKPQAAFTSKAGVEKA